ncbi:hypothetical protein BHM03_00017562 [Ensete ventricosum]|nr:hypothetical protein BHM03_00017562 [Ensete ventricosum]
MGGTDRYGKPWLNAIEKLSISRFEISSCIARYGRYIPVRQFTGTRTTYYRMVPPKIDRRWSILAVGGRLRENRLSAVDCGRSEIGEKGKKKKKRRNRTSTVAARRLPVRCRRPHPRAIFLPREEKDQGDYIPSRTGWTMYLSPIGLHSAVFHFPVCYMAQPFVYYVRHGSSMIWLLELCK